MKRARRAIKTYLGRVSRDAARKLAAWPEAAERFSLPLAQKAQLLAQQHNNKLYVLHAPEVACIAKDKAK